MANKDRSKMDYYFKMNVYDFLNHYCFLIDKNEQMNINKI